MSVIPKFGQVGNLFDQGAEGAAVADPGAGVPGETSNVEFVKDAVFIGAADGLVSFPVVVVIRFDAAPESV